MVRCSSCALEVGQNNNVAKVFIFYKNKDKVLNSFKFVAGVLNFLMFWKILTKILTQPEKWPVPMFCYNTYCK